MTSLETSATDAEHLSSHPGPEAPASEWAAWANGTPQLRGLGITCTATREGGADFSVPAVPYAPNPNGSVNGGMLAATASLPIQFHRPALAPLAVSAQLLPGGNRVKFVEVVLRDAAGNHCATAQGTMVVGGAGRPQPEDQPGEFA